MCFGGHPLARAALALAVTGQRGRAVRLATDIADPWIRSAAWTSIVASGRGAAADAAAALAAALAIGAAHEQVLALAELAWALRERSPSSALDAARHAAGVAARSPARLLGLSDLMWPRHARYGSVCRERADWLRGYCQQLPPGPDDEVSALLARSFAQAGLLADVELASYALSRAELREAHVRCFTGFVLAEATAGDPDFRNRADPAQALLTATAERVVAGVFLRHGQLSVARDIFFARGPQAAAAGPAAAGHPARPGRARPEPAGPEPTADEARGRRWLELLADLGPAAEARAACARAADPDLPLARLAWRHAAAGAAPLDAR
jgi:hypothetical protein